MLQMAYQDDSKVNGDATSSLVGDGIAAARAAWHFGGDVPRNFDAHVRRSVPFYREGHTLIEQISDFFVTNHSTAYDIGMSTGTLLHRLANRHSKGTRWIGIDVEARMVEFAQASSRPVGKVEYVVADACDVALEPADFILSYYSIQFVPPRRRQALLDSIYAALNWGGAFLMFEKVRAPDARFQDLASALYVDYKLANGYSPDEIIGKAHSLRGVLEPFSTNGNLDLLKRAGFVDIMSVYKYVCFEGFLAIK